MSVLTVLAKTVGLYVAALASFRLMGKRTLGDMEPLDFVVVLVIAEVVAAPLADPGLAVPPALVAVAALTAIQLALAWVSMRSKVAQKVLEGEAVVVVREGRVIGRNLRKARVTPAELSERLRERGYLGPEDVELAVLEIDGMLSAIPRKHAAPVTPRFLGLRPSTVLLVHGRPNRQGLDRAGMSERDLMNELARYGVRPRDLEEAILTPDGRLRLTMALPDVQKRGRGLAGKASKKKGKIGSKKENP